MKKVLDFVGGILAFLTVIMYALIFIDGAYNFLPDVATNFMKSIQTLAVLVVCGITGLEFAVARKNIIIKILFILILAVTIIAMFFPGALISIGIDFN